MPLTVGVVDSLANEAMRDVKEGVEVLVVPDPVATVSQSIPAIWPAFVVLLKSYEPGTWQASQSFSLPG